MTDLEILMEVERQLGIGFKETIINEIFELRYTANARYSTDSNKNVIALRIEELAFPTIITLIKSLPHLKILNLSNNRLENISFLTNLIHLTDIYLSRNSINNISPLKELTQLTVIHLWNNEISDISYLKNLKKLKDLNLSRNRVVNILPLEDLKELENLNLSNNRLENISALKKLKALKMLDISDNSIMDISAVKELKFLTRLDLQANPIKKISPWITDFDIDIQWHNYGAPGFISFFDNPIQSPPKEIIRQGKQAIKDWLSANKKKLNEIKVLFVGEAKSGKTSLISKLKKNVYNPSQDQTDGIVIESFKFDELETFYQQDSLHGTMAYFWDFGGQEILCSTHEFFMTNRAIYILILEARRDSGANKQVRDWMERIQVFGGNSHVIVVCNKIDINPSFGVDTTVLQKDFPQIKRFINVSCQTGENIEKLKEILAEYIPQAELFNTEIDERWIQIKDDLQYITGKEFTLSHKEFVKICENHGLEDDVNQTQAIRFLNDLGILLHFDDLALSEYYVLDPLWVTAGVYRIITSETAARQKGEIEIADLHRIVNEETKQSHTDNHRAIRHVIYSRNECRYLADIMVEFKLGYYTDNNRKLLIPDLLEKETPKEEDDRFNNATEKLCFTYTYKYMPATIMPRIMVELKQDVIKAWHTGIVLKCKDNIKTEAMVTTVENRINIVILGEHRQKRDYLSIIRHIINQINKSYTLEVEMQIPLPGYEKHYIKYDHLIKLEKKGKKIYEDLDIDKEFDISMLLYGIFTKEEIGKQIENNSITHIYMGDQYTISGQAGAVGPNSSAIGNTFNQLNNTLPVDTNFEALTTELANLKQTLLAKASASEHYKAIGDVAAAEDGSKSKDGNKVLKFLGSAGEWALDIAKEVGSKVLVEIIEKGAGLK